jgi:hypothetical protein
VLKSGFHASTAVEVQYSWTWGLGVRLYRHERVLRYVWFKCNIIWKYLNV